MSKTRLARIKIKLSEVYKILEAIETLNVVIGGEVELEELNKALDKFKMAVQK